MIWAGEFEELEQAQKRLSVIVPISILLILGLLYGLFNSLRDSLVVLAGFLFAVAGGLLALYFSGEAFGISAAIGFVSLLGISVMNGILLITYFNEIHSGGVPAGQAMCEAATHRMRAVLMTGFSAAIGLLPAAFSTAIGSQVQRPLAIVVVGGMMIGPILLLIFVPALQTLILGKGGGARAERVAEAENA
jgi:cobalt-zinc-cadmium resistance protein CzcA